MCGFFMQEKVFLVNSFEYLFFLFQIIILSYIGVDFRRFFIILNFESKLMELCNSMVFNLINDFFCCKEIKKIILFYFVYLYICDISVVFMFKGQ